MNDEKMLVDLDKPGSEENQLTGPTDDVAGWLNEEVDVFDLAAEMLKEEGVHTIFGLTAGGCWNMEGHALKAGIERVHVRTEETATFAADAYGRRRAPTAQRASRRYDHSRAKTVTAP